MEQTLSITKAMADGTRLRALYALREGELCVCQLIELLELAPATVSRHLELLRQAGLVRRRKRGRWQFYSLAGREAPRAVREALRFALRALEDDDTIGRDTRRLERIRQRDLQELTACYRTTTSRN